MDSMADPIQASVAFALGAAAGIFEAGKGLQDGESESPEHHAAPTPTVPAQMPGEGIASSHACAELGLPRRLSVLHVLEELTDDEAVFCGPYSESDDEALPSELYFLQAWALGPFQESTLSRRERREEVARSGLHPLIQPPNDIEGEPEKYVCIFHVGLEDDDEFCLVKRLIGKGGHNMLRISTECNAKVRLRGRGSGFLEGSSREEAPIPLQLHVSCTCYADYVYAVDNAAALLRDLYKAYRRHKRFQGTRPEEVRLRMDEVRPSLQPVENASVQRPVKLARSSARAASQHAAAEVGADERRTLRLEGLLLGLPDSTQQELRRLNHAMILQQMEAEAASRHREAARSRKSSTDEGSMHRKSKANYVDKQKDKGQNEGKSAGKGKGGDTGTTWRKVDSGKDKGRGKGQRTGEKGKEKGKATVKSKSAVMDTGKGTDKGKESEVKAPVQDKCITGDGKVKGKGLGKGEIHCEDIADTDEEEDATASLQQTLQPCTATTCRASPRTPEATPPRRKLTSDMEPPSPVSTAPTAEHLSASPGKGSCLSAVSACASPEPSEPMSASLNEREAESLFKSARQQRPNTGGATDAERPPAELSDVGWTAPEKAPHGSSEVSSKQDLIDLGQWNGSVSTEVSTLSATRSHNFNLQLDGAELNSKESLI